MFLRLRQPFSAFLRLRYQQYILVLALVVPQAAVVTAHVLMPVSVLARMSGRGPVAKIIVQAVVLATETVSQAPVFAWLVGVALVVRRKVVAMVMAPALLKMGLASVTLVGQGRSALLKSCAWILIAPDMASVRPGIVIVVLDFPVSLVMCQMTVVSVVVDHMGAVKPGQSSAFAKPGLPAHIVRSWNRRVLAPVMAMVTASKDVVFAMHFGRARIATPQRKRQHRQL